MKAEDLKKLRGLIDKHYKLGLKVVDALGKGTATAKAVEGWVHAAMAAEDLTEDLSNKEQA